MIKLTGIEIIHIGKPGFRILQNFSLRGFPNTCFKCIKPIDKLELSKNNTYP